MPKHRKPYQKTFLFISVSIIGKSSEFSLRSKVADIDMHWALSVNNKANNSSINNNSGSLCGMKR